MKVFKKFNLPLCACAVVVTTLFAIEPTLISSICCGFCLGMFASDTISNWKTR